jgi:hypothetical protein
MRIARSLKLWTVIFIISVPFLFSIRGVALPRLELRVADSSAIPGDTGQLGIYLTNRLDTVAAFELTLLVDKPNLIGLIPAFDSANTLTSGWEYLAAIVVLSPQPGIKITGVANLISPPKIVPGIPVSTVPRLLLRVPFYAKVISDTVSDRTARIYFSENTSEFGVASKEGQLIGLVQDTLYDTACFRCTRYLGPDCQTYVPSSPPCDSISISYSLANPHFDTTQITLTAGSILLLPNCHPVALAGDIDGNGRVDSADLQALAAFVQYGSPQIASPSNADLNKDCCINWADYSILSRLLTFGRDSVVLPSCVCPNPVRCCCVGRRGNVNNDRSGVVDLGDLTLLVAYMTGGTSQLPCQAEADVNGSGVVDLGDLSSLVAYMVGAGPLPAACP